MPQTVSTFLMFEGAAEEAMRFYVSLFADSSIDEIERWVADVLTADELEETRSYLKNRVTLLALKGSEPEVHGMPGARGAPRPRWPERERAAREPGYTLWSRLRAKLRRTRPVGRL